MPEAPKAPVWAASTLRIAKGTVIQALANQGNQGLKRLYKVGYNDDAR